MNVRAVIFDLGGVVFPSPFEAFDAHNERAGLPTEFVRSLIRESSETGAWAAHERGELSMDEFVRALEAEARVAGQELDVSDLMSELGRGFGPRPEMVRAIRAIRAAGLRTAALTNNWRADPGHGVDGALEREHLFDVVVESAVEGIRKPQPEIYELVLSRLRLSAAECVFLDDLGVNLKPARAMGMTTIKVSNARAALTELGGTLGLDLIGAG